MYGVIPRPDLLDLAPRHDRVQCWFDDLADAQSMRDSFYGGFADIIEREPDAKPAPE